MLQSSKFTKNSYIYILYSLYKYRRLFLRIKNVFQISYLNLLICILNSNHYNEQNINPECKLLLWSFQQESNYAIYYGVFNRCIINATTEHGTTIFSRMQYIFAIRLISLRVCTSFSYHKCD